MDDRHDVTGLLKAFGSDDHAVDEELAALVYDELHRRAQNIFSREQPGRTLQPTGLVHEAWAKLSEAKIDYNDRAHFYAVATRMMKRFLINEATARRAAKRGGDRLRVSFVEEAESDAVDHDLLQLTDALAGLEKVAPRQAQLVELHYFGGMSGQDMAEMTGLSTATIQRDLRFARAWLKDEIETSYD